LGNIHSPRFIVEEGVIFNGTAKIVQALTKTDHVKAPVEEAEPESYAPGEDSAAEKQPVAVSGTSDGRGAGG
jgi:hypothetical protein